MKNNIRFIILSPSPFSPWWKDTLCTDDLSKCFDLEYWDCSGIAFPNFEVQQKLQRPYVKVIDSFQQLNKEIKILPADAVIFTDIFFVKQNYRLYEIVSKRFKKIVDMDIWSYSIEDILSQKSDNTVEVCCAEPLTIRGIYTDFYLKCVRKFIKLGLGEKFKAVYSLLKEEKKNRINQLYESKCSKLFDKFYRITWKQDWRYVINLPDYEKYLRVRDSAPEISEKYILYIDQFLFFHPDSLLSEENNDAAKKSKIFYKYLNSYFSFLEDEYDCKVIIAGHPRAHYPNNPFGGREIIYYKTAELIRDSFAVCGHFSNSFIYVVLFDKPFAFIDAPDESDRKKNIINRFSSLTRMPLIHLNDSNEYSTSFRHVDRDILSEFLNKIQGNRCGELNKVLFERHIRDIYDDMIN